MIAVDDVAPLVLEVDVESGEVRAVRSWTVPAFSGQPVANDVEVVDGSIVVASPAAGGVVFIHRDTGQATTVSRDRVAERAAETRLTATRPRRHYRP